jgi:hypothetical protein
MGIYTEYYIISLKLIVLCEPKSNSSLYCLDLTEQPRSRTISWSAHNSAAQFHDTKGVPDEQFASSEY